MADGQANNRVIGAIVQARMQSSRLPGKVLMPLPFNSDKPLLAWPVTALKKSSLINKIIIATSVNAENEPLQKIAKELEVDFYRGDEENVLKRFADVISEHGLETAVRITADNAIVDIELIDYMIRAHINGNYDYSYSSHLPLGMNIEVFNAKALLAFSEKADLTNEDREHVTYYFSRTNHYRTFYPKLLEENMTGRIRLTMDYPADYAVLNLVTQIAEQTNLSGMQLVHYVDLHYPWIWNTNNNMYQKKQFQSAEEELHFVIDLLHSFELNHTEKLLRQHLYEKSGSQG